MIKTKGWDSGCLIVLGCPAGHLLPGWLSGSHTSYLWCRSGNALLPGLTWCEREAPDFPSSALPSPLVAAGLARLSGPVAPVLVSLIFLPAKLLNPQFFCAASQLL